MILVRTCLLIFFPIHCTLSLSCCYFELVLKKEITLGFLCGRDSCSLIFFLKFFYQTITSETRQDCFIVMSATLPQIPQQMRRNMNEEREYHSPKDSIDTKLYPLLSSGHLFLLFGTALLSLYDQAQVKLLNFAVLPPLPVPGLNQIFFSH